MLKFKITLFLIWTIKYLKELRNSLGHREITIFVAVI